MKKAIMVFGLASLMFAGFIGSANAKTCVTLTVTCDNASFKAEACGDTAAEIVQDAWGKSIIMCGH